MARRAGFALLLAALAVVWAIAAWLLWESVVPDDLRLPHVSASDVLSADELAKARSYERFLRFSFLASLVVLLVVFGLYARFGARFVRESAAGRIGTGMLLGMLGFAILWLVQVPFGMLDLWWQRRHDTSELGYLDWIVLNWFALGGEFLFVCLALLIVMGLAGPLGNWWWIPGGAAFVALALVFTFISPYLIPEQRHASPRVEADADRLAEEEGLPDVPIRVQQVDSWEAPNAAAVGLGPTRRVILWNTLVDRFDENEVRVVLGHELGHHERNHLWKSIAWYALFAFPGALLIAWGTRRRGGMKEPTAVPLALLVLVALEIAALPAQNAITRHMEAEADWVALETTREPAAATSLFQGFSQEALLDPSPPTWAFVLMENHPSIAERVAMVEAWQARGGR